MGDTKREPGGPSDRPSLTGTIITFSGLIGMAAGFVYGAYSQSGVEEGPPFSLIPVFGFLGLLAGVVVGAWIAAIRRDRERARDRERDLPPT